MIHHCVLPVQSMSLMSAASTPLIHYIAVFVSKAFSFDCTYIIYIITNIMIMVTSAAVNKYMSARKLLRNDLNSEFSLVYLIPGLSYLKFSFCFSIELPNLVKFFGSLSKLGLISKVSIDRGSICSWVVQFCKTGIPQLFYNVIEITHQSQIYCKMHF